MFNIAINAEERDERVDLHVGLGELADHHRERADRVRDCQMSVSICPQCWPRRD
jgi:hypothetical protein